MKISMDRTYEGDPQALRQRLGQMETKLQSKYRAKTKWISDDTMSIGAPGVDGRLSFDQTRVWVDLDLSFALRPLKGTIERELGKELDSVAHA